MARDPQDDPSITALNWLMPEQLVRILESVGDPFYVVDEEWRFIYLNQQTAQLWGMERDTLIGKSLWEVHPSLYDTPQGELTRRCAIDRQPRNADVLSPVLKRWINLTIYPFVPGGVIIYFRDITPQKQAEEWTAHLYELTRALSASLTIQQVADVILEKGLAALKGHVAYMGVLDDSETEIRLLGERHMTEATRQRFAIIPLSAHNPIADCARTGEPLWLAGIDTFRAQYPELVQHLTLTATGYSMICTPLILKDRTLGVLAVSRPDSSEASPNERAFFDALARQCAQALDRARVHEQSERDAAQMQAIFENMTEGVLVADMRGNMLYFNRAALELHGHQSLAEVQRPLTEIEAGWDLYDLEGSRLPIREWPISRAMRGPFTDYELRVRRIDTGREFIGSYNGALVYDRDGQPSLVVVTLEDITRRKRDEVRTAHLYQLAQALSSVVTVEQVAEAILDEMLAGIGAAGGYFGVIDEAQKAITLFSGRNIPEAQRQRFSTIPLDSRLPLAEAARTGQPVWVESTQEIAARYSAMQSLLELPAGFAFACLPLIAHGRTLGVLAIGWPYDRPISADERVFLMAVGNQCAQALERARLYEVETAARRAAEEANALKDKFLAMVSHELRTPLASIMGFATTLLAEDVTWDIASQREFVEIINAESERLKELIETLLDISKLQARMLTVRLEPRRLSDVIDNLHPQLITLTAQHDLRLNLPNHLPAVLMDARRIGQVITNLVHNAVKYSPANTRITVTAFEDDDMVQVRVIDEGRGIPEDARDYIFEAFRQVSPERGASHGAGLGLAISRGLVNAHGGRIWAESHTGPGTTICFTLPIASSS